MSFFGLLQLTTALVLILSGISETSARLCWGHGLFHCASIHDVGHGVFIHSYFQLENDQIYGIFYVCVLLPFCGHHTRIWIWFLGLPNLEQVHTTVAVPYNIRKQCVKKIHQKMHQKKFVKKFVNKFIKRIVKKMSCAPWGQVGR